MLAEVALTFHVFGSAPGSTPPLEVSEEAVQYAIRYMRKARRHAHTLYSSILSSAPAFELARALARSVVASEEPVPSVSRDWMTTHCQAFRKADDLQAASLVLSRCAPALRPETYPVQFDFDPTAPVAQQIEKVLAAMAGGAVSPDVGRQIIDAIGTLSNARAVEELEARIITLEAKQV